MEINNGAISDWILYKDNQLLIFNKPVGLLTQSDQEESKSLVDLAEIYCKHPVFPLHRLDRPAGGVVIFAKNKKALNFLNEQLEKRAISKKYLAWVKNPPKQESGELVHYIKRNGRLKKAFVEDQPKPNHKEAILKYKTVYKSDNYTLLEVDLVTGRFHQIRAQLGKIGSPIKGDVKYGARRSNPDRSIDLFAQSITFKHPTQLKSQTIKAPLPDNPLWQSAGIE